MPLGQFVPAGAAPSICPFSEYGTNRTLQNLERPLCETLLLTFV